MNRTEASHTLRVAPQASRTRRNHGVFLIGDELACVYSSRRLLDSLSVTLSIGAGSLVLNGGMTPQQARGLASALVGAAVAAEKQQQTGGAA